MSKHFGKFLVCTLLLLFSCSDRSDGFGSETTNGTVAVDVVLPDSTTDAIRLEVTLIPRSFNPLQDSDTLITRDTILSSELSSLTSVIEGTYNLIVNSLNDTVHAKLYHSNLNVEAGKSVSIVDTLQSTGNLIIQYTNLSQIEPYTLYIPGTDITKDGGKALVVDDTIVTIHIDSLPVGKLPPFLLWDFDMGTSYQTTDSLQIYPDSTVTIRALL